MAKSVTPRVEDTNTDRALKSLDAAVSRLIQSPMANGVMVRGFKPGVDGPLRVPHGMGRRANGALIVGSDRGIFRATVIKSDRESVTLGVSREWEILDRVDVKADLTAAFDFDYAANGDLDYEYRIEGFWKTGLGTLRTAYWRINGLSTSLTSEGSSYDYQDGSTGTSSGIVIAKTVNAAATEHLFVAELAALSGGSRMAFSTDSQTWGTTTSTNTHGTAGGKWEDTAVTIKTVGLVFGTSDCLAGSHFTLSRRPRLVGRTLNIWIF